MAVRNLTLRLVTCKPSEVDVVMVDRGLVERTVQPLIKWSMERVVNREVKALDPLAAVIGMESEVGLVLGSDASEDPLILCEVGQALGGGNVGVGPMLSVDSGEQVGGLILEHNGSGSLKNTIVGPGGDF